MAGSDFEIHAYESSFEEMGAQAVKELSFGSGAYEIDGHTHEDGEPCEPMTGVTFSIMATTFDDAKHTLLFTPRQIALMGGAMAEFLIGLREAEDEASE